jgi:predicted transcriptional regulator
VRGFVNNILMWLYPNKGKIRIFSHCKNWAYFLLSISEKFVYTSTKNVLYEELFCMTLTELRQSVPMSIPELARAARVDDQTVRNAESGQRISARVARSIAEALSEALGRTIQVRDIDGLQVRT